jgi:hypothetical protein
MQYALLLNTLQRGRSALSPMTDAILHNDFGSALDTRERIVICAACMEAGQDCDSGFRYPRCLLQGVACERGEDQVQVTEQV